MFIELMVRHQMVLDIKVLQQIPARASVLRQHKVSLSEQPDSTHSHILHVAHRSWNDVQDTHYGVQM